MMSDFMDIWFILAYMNVGARNLRSTPLSIQPLSYISYHPRRSRFSSVPKRRMHVILRTMFHPTPWYLR